MTPSLVGWPTKAKEAPSPHEVRLTLLDTKPSIPMPVPRLPVTFGWNQEQKNKVINIGLVRLAPRQWPEVGRRAAK